MFFHRLRSLHSLTIRPPVFTSTKPLQGLHASILRLSLKPKMTHAVSMATAVTCIYAYIEAFWSLSDEMQEQQTESREGVTGLPGFI
ncbi:Protein of unknown function [Pyronema omphalodes CBS 100304]|uniref:Uncharacterized protein n=1 Tax=Pyronema omphalodes (strain CBS 100304) TaxID=1076935 RepID=U4LER4_PYROM|nr:Protein of unknown function [Pyronema omphalodes CBS 100304]